MRNQDELLGLITDLIHFDNQSFHFRHNSENLKQKLFPTFFKEGEYIQIKYTRHISSKKEPYQELFQDGPNVPNTFPELSKAISQEEYNPKIELSRIDELIKEHDEEKKEVAKLENIINDIPQLSVKFKERAEYYSPHSGSIKEDMTEENVAEQIKNMVETIFQSETSKTLFFMLINQELGWYDTINLKSLKEKKSESKRIELPETILETFIQTAQAYEKKEMDFFDHNNSSYMIGHFIPEIGENISRWLDKLNTRFEKVTPKYWEDNFGKIFAEESAETIKNLEKLADDYWARKIGENGEKTKSLAGTVEELVLISDIYDEAYSILDDFNHNTKQRLEKITLSLERTDVEEKYRIELKKNIASLKNDLIDYQKTKEGLKHKMEYNLNAFQRVERELNILDFGYACLKNNLEQFEEIIPKEKDSKEILYPDSPNLNSEFKTGFFIDAGTFNEIEKVREMLKQIKVKRNNLEDKYNITLDRDNVQINHFYHQHDCCCFNPPEKIPFPGVIRDYHDYFKRSKSPEEWKLMQRKRLNGLIEFTEG